MTLWWRHFVLLLDTMILKVWKKGIWWFPCRMKWKVSVIQLSHLSFINHCSIYLSSSTSLGNLLKCLPSPHVLSLLRVSGKLYAMRTLVFPGFLSLIDMVVSFFYFRENIQFWAWKRKWECFQWVWVCLWFGQAANCYTSSNFPSFPSHVDAGHDCSSEQLWQPSVPVDSVAHYPLNPANSPHGRHHFPPAYRVKYRAKGWNNLSKAMQRAGGCAQVKIVWGLAEIFPCLGNSDHVGSRQQSLHYAIYFLHEFTGVAISLSRG